MIIYLESHLYTLLKRTTDSLVVSLHSYNHLEQIQPRASWLAPRYQSHVRIYGDLRVPLVLSLARRRNRHRSRCVEAQQLNRTVKFRASDQFDRCIATVDALNATKTPAQGMATTTLVSTA
ncbi:hypothetical protein HPP92_003867 [Vanilla planifolia]|uniref:Uncharacterized protein n=1 Tax=Vanilla planifolia TaxID=51239 RepID=A0A835S3T5_VANPL|nr:hypothetical protein HPP92_003867 [Vanilla planifolia]